MDGERIGSRLDVNAVISVGALRVRSSGSGAKRQVSNLGYGHDKTC